MVVFFLLLLVIRGLPSLLIYRKVLPLRQRVEMTFITATALPLLVALAEIGLRDGKMLPSNAAALVGAGALSVLVFPAIATAMARTDRARAAPDRRSRRQREPAKAASRAGGAEQVPQARHPARRPHALAPLGRGPPPAHRAAGQAPALAAGPARPARRRACQAEPALVRDHPDDQPAAGRAAGRGRSGTEKRRPPGRN